MWYILCVIFSLQCTARRRSSATCLRIWLRRNSSFARTSGRSYKILFKTLVRHYEKHEVAIKNTHGRGVLFFLRSSVKKCQILSLLHSVFFSPYNRVLSLAWPLWRARDKTIFFFSRRRRGQSKAAALNSRKRKIREIEELQAMLGRPWWVFFCAEQFFWETHQDFIFESNLSYCFFRLVSMPLNGCFFRFSVFFCISYTVEHLLTRYKKSRTSEQHNLDSH